MLHAVLWIVLYIVVVNVGDALSASVGLANIVTAPLVVMLAIVAVLYVRANGWFKEYGLKLPGARESRAAWHYVPLVLILIAPLIIGTWSGLNLSAIGLVVVLMLGVGFIEELIFRGFLYRAIFETGGLWTAVIISGVTFGLGHIVNLLRGYTGGEQLVQIGMGIVLGIVLALLFAVTGSILPGALFHVLLNIEGSLTQRALSGDVVVMLLMTLVCIIYGAYLVTLLRRGTRPGWMDRWLPKTATPKTLT